MFQDAPAVASGDSLPRHPSVEVGAAAESSRWDSDGPSFAVNVPSRRAGEQPPHSSAASRVRSRAKGALSRVPAHDIDPELTGLHGRVQFGEAARLF